MQSIFQTPPSSYRRQVDIQYNSLPRPSFPNSPASNNSTLNSSGRAPSSSTNSSLSTTIDSNANPKQRNVAFGKQITNHLPYSASKSATNIYHHQLVLYQHPEPTPSISSPPISHNFQQKQRGVSVPNLGFYVHKTNYYFFYSMQMLLFYFLIYRLHFGNKKRITCTQHARIKYYTYPIE